MKSPIFVWDVNAYINKNVCIYVYIYMYTYIYIYVYTYIHITSQTKIGEVLVKFIQGLTTLLGRGP